MIDYFIICHDQEIIEEKISNNSFTGLPNFKFLFVGDKKISRNDENIIVCRNLPNNIESYPKLCSFTGWYAVSKNNLSTQKYSCLLEYDVEITKDFHESNLQSIKTGVEAYGYFREPINDPMFTRSTPWLDAFTIKTHGLDVKNFIDTNCAEHEFWYCTSNFLIQNKTMDNFNDWFYDLAVFKNDGLGSYMHERMINIYLILNKYKIEYISVVLKHLQLCSHSNKDLYLNQNIYKEELKRCLNY